MTVKNTVYQVLVKAYPWPGWSSRVSRLVRKAKRGDQPIFSR